MQFLSKFWTKCASLGVLALAVSMVALPGLAVRAQPIEEYTPPKFDGRVAQIWITNPYSEKVTITLWHPDSRARQASWTVEPGQTVSLGGQDGQPLNIGSDWGVQMNDLPIIPVRNAPLVKLPGGAQTWDVKLDAIYR